MFVVAMGSLIVAAVVGVVYGPRPVETKPDVVDGVVRFGLPPAEEWPATIPCPAGVPCEGRELRLVETVNLVGSADTWVAQEPTTATVICRRTVATDPACALLEAGEGVTEAEAAVYTLSP